MANYVTLKDIVIPAGTKVHVQPPHRRGTAIPFASILTAETKDSTSEWQMPLDEAVVSGLIGEMPKHD